jgi:hypothetical protein
MTNKIKAEIVTHSKRRSTGEEIITYKLTFPRIILSEVNTYKMMEKNTSSSRAIPFEKMVEVVEKEPFIPLAWQLSHKGMQGTKYITDPKVIEFKEMRWLNARNTAVESAKKLVEDDITIKKLLNTNNSNELSKNYGNRLIEPFMWTTQLITGIRESFEHLFEQRCPIYNVENLKFNSKKEALELYPHLKDMTDLEWLQCNSGQAEIHFMDLAEKMYDALNESTPDELFENEWHIPFKEEILFKDSNISLKDLIKISVCLTAKVSYTKIGDENSITIEKAREMYERLKNSQHWSCFGHIGRCMTDEEYENWLKGKVKGYYSTNIEKQKFVDVDGKSFLHGVNRDLVKPYFDLKDKGWNKHLKGFISLRQYVEDGVELKDA